jgi:hypothetical protein
VSLLVCNLLIVITSLYRLLRTPPTLVEVGKSPIIPALSSTRENNSGSSSGDENDGTSGTGGSKGNVSGNGRGRRGSEKGNDDTGTGTGSNYPRTATPPSTGTVIEFTEIYESDLSFT